ncbi:hypothetical protein [Domibacillus mangrovi]|uniref:Uncharacterized protein n=1 Tax=Domibacillus mangrovi TaxID=1714354 RepID=A0A1Q5P4E4_9BACI|nr:hypothetical protein [Domibacillus mangrovi]OKL37011.1 hypothetical protein BLL40_05310 [Domibacillus mangrovi]
MSKNVFTKKERNKLLFSETLKRSNLPWLVEILNNKNTPKYTDLNAEQRQTLSELRSELLNNSIDEWIITKAPGTKHLTLNLGPKEQEWMKCQLCGTKNRYIHFIKNKFTEITINVGSDCIEEFGEIGRAAQKDKRRLISNQNKNRRLVKLLEIIPDARSRVEKWDGFLNEIDIILPSRIEEAYKKLGIKAEKLFKSILNKNQSEKEVQALKKVFQEQIEYKEKILKYVNVNKNRTFVMTKEIDDWLKVNKTNDYIRISEVVKGSGNGFIIPEIAHEINEPSFLKTIANQYNRNIDNNILKIERITNNGFVISVFPLLNIYLEISNRIFTKKYSNFAFGEKSKFDVEFLLLNSQCYRNTDRNKLVDELKKILSSMGMKIASIDTKKNRIDIECIDLKKYFRFDLEKFVESNKQCLYLYRPYELKTEILKNSNSFSQWEYKNLIKREKEIQEAYQDDMNRKRNK